MTRLTTLTLALALSTLSPLAAGTAQAGHRSYCWTGPRVGCPGEGHMIRALDSLERAYQTRHDAAFHYWLDRVEREVHGALRESCSLPTRRHLRNALRHVHAARVSHAPCDLDEAYEELVDALEHEQRVFRPVPLPSYRRAVPRYVPVPVPAPHPHGGITIHGRRFGIHFDF